MLKKFWFIIFMSLLTFDIENYDEEIFGFPP